MSGQDQYDDNDPVTDIDGNVIPGMTKGRGGLTTHRAFTSIFRNSNASYA
jgi:hypothetical protein